MKKGTILIKDDSLIIKFSISQILASALDETSGYSAFKKIVKAENGHNSQEYMFEIGERYVGNLMENLCMLYGVKKEEDHALENLENFPDEFKGKFYRDGNSSFIITQEGIKDLIEKGVKMPFYHEEIAKAVGAQKQRFPGGK